MPEVAASLSQSGAPPRFAGALPLLGHMAKFARDPVAMMQAVREACGPVGEFRMLNKHVVLLSGPVAQEAFCPGERQGRDCPRLAARAAAAMGGEAPHGLGGQRLERQPVSVRPAGQMAR